MMRVVVIAGLFLLALSARAETLAGPYEASVVRVLDGDSFEARVRIWLDQDVTVIVRLAGVDAAELDAPCARARIFAFAARRFLDARIGGGPVTLSAIRRDKFGGRVVARAAAGGVDVADALSAAGLVRPYGGRRPDWCSVAGARIENEEEEGRGRQKSQNNPSPAWAPAARWQRPAPALCCGQGDIMQQIGPGSSSLYVRLAQHLLNRRLRRTPGFRRLREDGAFGPRTTAAVRTFQALNHVGSEPGVIGRLTWRALGVTIEVDHPVTMRSQHYDMGCWAAAAAMVLNRDMSVGTNGAELGKTRGLLPTIDNVTQFVTQFGWHVMSPPANVTALADILAGGPIWLAGMIILEDGSTGGHVVVVSGAWGDGSPYGTYVRIHDPWPVNHGDVTICTYPGMVAGGGLPFDPFMIAGTF